ncbi:MAG: non-ribosomal peptide synthetase, partial [Bacteroidota bacterium]
NIVVEKKNLLYLDKITEGNALSKFVVLAAIYILLLEKFKLGYNGTLKISNLPFEEKRQVPILFSLRLNDLGTIKELIVSVRNQVHQYLNNDNGSFDYGENDFNGDSQNSYPIFGVGNDVDSKLVTCSISMNYEAKSDGGLHVSLFFEKKRFRNFEISAFLKYFKTCLRNLEEIVEKNIDKLSIITKSDEKQILDVFNSTKISYPKSSTVVDLFEKQVKSTPDEIAVLYQEKQITYRELNDQANQFARYLQSAYGIEKGNLVCIKLDRNEYLMPVIYGILKCGAAYVPISTEYPKQRVDYILNDTKSKVIIDDVKLNTFINECSSFGKENLDVDFTSEDLCYVIYTSGTTGNPKGVMIPHHALINRLSWMQKAYPLTQEDILIQKTTYTFDVSVWEIFWWSLYGAKLLIPQVNVEKNPADLVQNILQNKVSVIHFVPSMLSVFLNHIKNNPNEKEALISLKQVFVSGEALKVSQRNLFYQELPEVSLMNLYGPTEATIDVSYYDCKVESEYDCIPIGKPIDNTSLYILDNQLNLLPVGATGRLFIGGVGVARGYINKAELTQQKFIANPFVENEKMYDTGDLACWLPDGNIDFKGRNDHQVKLRGFRIELGEIEHALLKLSDIDEVVVLVTQFNEKPVLVAYFVSTMMEEKTDLRAQLKLQLPEYMIPNFFIKIKSFPLTHNGKLDRKALPDIEVHFRDKQNFVAPESDLEKEVVSIWEEVLGIKGIGVSDNFFDLGGHSLLMTEIINRINKKLSYDIAVKEFISAPTVKSMIQHFKTSKHTAIPNSVSDFDEVII